jgi:hypothetical protein
MSASRNLNPNSNENQEHSDKTQHRVNDKRARIMLWQGVDETRDKSAKKGGARNSAEFLPPALVPFVFDDFQGFFDMPAKYLFSPISEASTFDCEINDSAKSSTKVLTFASALG